MATIPISIKKFKLELALKSGKHEAQSSLDSAWIPPLQQPKRTSSHLVWINSKRQVVLILQKGKVMPRRRANSKFKLRLCNSFSLSLTVGWSNNKTYKWTTRCKIISTSNQLRMDGSKQPMVQVAEGTRNLMVLHLLITPAAPRTLLQGS